MKSANQQLYAPVFEGLIDPKHIKNFGPHPLFMYLDLLIRETRNNGRVHNGVPIADSSLARQYGVDERTVRRWRAILVSGDYVNAERKAHGYVYTIKKSKKFAPKSDGGDRTKMSGHSSSVIGQKCPVTTTSDRTVESGVIGQLSPSDRTVESKDSLQPVDGTDTCASLNKKEVKEVVVQSTTAASISKSEMGRKVSAVWDYYQEATGSEEILSPSIKKVIAARLGIIVKPEEAVYTASCAIDAAVLASKRPKKKYMLQWKSIFGKEETFKSLIDDFRQGDIPAAAELPDEWIPQRFRNAPPVPQKTPEQTESEQQRKLEEKKLLDQKFAALWSSVKESPAPPPRETDAHQWPDW